MICSRSTLMSSVPRAAESRLRVGCPPSGRPEAAQGAERPGLPHVPALTRAPSVRHLMRFGAQHHSPRRTFWITSRIEPTAQYRM